MMKKLAPLIILGMFVLGTWYVIHGLNKATEMSLPQSGNAR
jgi:hypothetical protein